MTTTPWITKLPSHEAGFQILDLAHPLFSGMPHHPSHPPFGMSLTKLHGELPYSDGVTASSEVIVTGGHIGTHIDALSHMAKNGEVHGEISILTSQDVNNGMEIHGVESLPPYFAYASIIDLPSLLNREITPDDVIDAEVLNAWEAIHGPVDPIVLIRTGWDEYYYDNARFIGWNTGLPGVNIEGAKWLTDRSVQLVGSDTVAFEKAPTTAFPVHIHLLKQHGVPILEILNLQILAQKNIHRCFFVAAPLPIKGATGSPLRPLALVPNAEVNVP